MRHPTGRKVVLHYNKQCSCYTEGTPCDVKIYEIQTGEELLKK